MTHPVLGMEPHLHRRPAPPHRPQAPALQLLPQAAAAATEVRLRAPAGAQRRRGGPVQLPEGALPRRGIVWYSVM